jgi:uncharacterized protein YkwD
MKTITKNNMLVSGLTLSVLAVGSYNNELVASDFYGDTEFYQVTQVAGDSCEITEQQQHMLDLINAARSQAQSCGGESYQAVAPLTWSCQLGDSATTHTKDMTTYNFFGHFGSDGLRAGDRLFASGYDWSHYGENIGTGFISAVEAMDGFLESPGHCKNIMNPESTTFGSSMMSGDNLDYQSYWTQLFSAQM